MEDLEALRRHGYTFSDSDSSESSENEYNASSSLSSDDDEYKTLRPPPLQLSDLSNRIVRVKAIRTPNNLIQNQNNENKSSGRSVSSINYNLEPRTNVNVRDKLNNINNHDGIMPNPKNELTINCSGVKDESNDEDINQLPLNELVDFIDKIKTKYHKMIALNKKKIYGEQLSEATDTSNCDNLMPYFYAENLSEDISSIQLRDNHKDEFRTYQRQSQPSEVNSIQSNSSKVVLPISVAPKTPFSYSKVLKHETMNRDTSTQRVRTNNSDRSNSTNEAFHVSYRAKMPNSYSKVLKNQTINRHISTGRGNFITSEIPPVIPKTSSSLSGGTVHRTNTGQIHRKHLPKLNSSSQPLINKTFSYKSEEFPPLSLDPKPSRHRFSRPIVKSYNVISSNSLNPKKSSSYSKDLNRQTIKEYVSIPNENPNISSKPPDNIILSNSFKDTTSLPLDTKMSSSYSALLFHDLKLEKPLIKNRNIRKSKKVDKAISSDTENICSTRNNLEIFNKPTKHESLKSDPIMNSENLNIKSKVNSLTSNQKQKDQSNLKTVKSKTSKENNKTKNNHIKKTTKNNITLPKRNEKPIDCKNCEYHCNKFKPDFIRSQNTNSAFNTKKRIARGKRLHRVFNQISKNHDLYVLEKTAIGISFSIIILVLYGLYAIVFYK